MIQLMVDFQNYSLLVNSTENIPKYPNVKDLLKNE